MDYTDKIEAVHISLFKRLLGADENTSTEELVSLFKLTRRISLGMYSALALLFIFLLPMWIAVIVAVVGAWLIHGAWYGMTAAIKFGQFLIEEENKNA